MSADGIDHGRRRMLLAAATAMGGVGAVTVAVPFIKTMKPSAKAEAAGAPVEADLSKLEPGQMMTVEWRGKPVWIVRRNDAMLQSLKDVESLLSDPMSEDELQQPGYAKNPHRSSNPEYMVMIGICTHLGCSPTFRPELAPADLGADWKGGFFCPCHGSMFDLAGRVYSGVPAPTNLVVPPYRFIGESRIMVGIDPEVA